MTPKEENIVNISMKAAELFKAGKIELDEQGHMGLTQTILSLAERFEEKIKKEGIDYEADHAELKKAGQAPHDYWEDIDAFAEEQLLKEYGREEPALVDPVKLWVRVGMTLEVSQEDYEELVRGNGNDTLLSILHGETGRAYLDGETYFPYLEQNKELCDVEFSFYEPPEEKQASHAQSSEKEQEGQIAELNKEERIRLIKAMEQAGIYYNNVTSFTGWRAFDKSSERGNGMTVYKVFPSFASAKDWLLDQQFPKTIQENIQRVLNGEEPKKEMPAFSELLQQAEARAIQEKASQREDKSLPILYDVKDTQVDYNNQLGGFYTCSTNPVGTKDKNECTVSTVITTTPGEYSSENRSKAIRHHKRKLDELNLAYQKKLGMEPGKSDKKVKDKNNQEPDRG